MDLLLEGIVRCACNNLILQGFAQVTEVITIACHTHDEVPVGLWVLLGLT